MFRRSLVLTAGALALLCLTAAPGRLPAESRRRPGGIRPNGMPTAGTPAGLRSGPTTGVPVGWLGLWGGQWRAGAWSGTGRGWRGPQGRCSPCRNRHGCHRHHHCDRSQHRCGRCR